MSRVLKLSCVSMVVISAAALPACAEKLSIASPSGIIQIENKKKKKVERSKSGGSLKEGRIETKITLPTKTSTWHKNYVNGLQALKQRRFVHAEKLLMAAIKSTKGPSATKANLVKSRLALGKLYLAQNKYPEANEVYRITLSKAKSAFGSNSTEVAECKYGLSRTELYFGNNKKAKEYCESAIDILKQNGKVNTQLFGKSVHNMGLILAQFGWYEDTKQLFVPARQIMKTHPGYRNLDLAKVLKEQALFYHKIGFKKISNQLYEDSYRIKEAFVYPNKRPSLVGEIQFTWEQGSTRSKEIIDSEFPFRFMTANGIRVAATVIDLWELLGVLVTVTNTTDDQKEFDLGKVTLLKVDRRNLKRKKLTIPLIDPDSIDRVQKELSMWTLTHGRPWLANIQKTRTVRGLVPSKGHDLFRGPNVFGVYGKWKAVSHTVPKKVGLDPSRERVLDVPNKTEIALPGLLHKGDAKTAGVYPVWLEPFESRTGELFCLNPRDIDLLVRVPVGNAVFELPFHTKKKFPH